MKQLVDLISNSVKKLYSITRDVELVRPNSQFGDYASNIALQIYKELDKTPREIAEALVEEIKTSSLVEEASVAGPGFINIRVSAKSLEIDITSQWSDSYGSNDEGRGRTVVVEFPSPNMAKPYSVGHLRPGNQGWAIKRLMEETGWKVITDNHLGDYGTPFGIWAIGFKKFSSDEKLNEDRVNELGRIYIETKAALEAEKESGSRELADEVQAWLMKLDGGDAEAKALSERFNKISLDHIHEIMKRLEISTDYEMGEAGFAAQAKDIIENLINDGVADENADGSVVIELDGFDTPMLVQKSNGTLLYASTDIATLLWREDNWHPDRVIYCVGAEQQFHFAQLFELAKKIGIETELIHVWFGIIDQINEAGRREKMSSRKGVVLMEELLDAAEEKAREIVSDRAVSDEDIKTIALGAIKYSDFMSDRRTNILFSWDKIFALNGVSGPYVQYAAVRVNRILSENIVPKVDISGYNYDSEKNLLLKLLDYPEVIKLAARDLEPHKVAAYLYELAREMNRYYETTPVATGSVGEVEKAARLILLQKVLHVFNHGLSILGIRIPISM